MARNPVGHREADDLDKGALAKSGLKSHAVRMVLVVIDDRGRCTISGVKPGAYDAETGSDGTILLVPLVRATDRRTPARGAQPVVRAAQSRKSFRRSWDKVPPGTVLVGPPEVGRVVMALGGLLDTGRTPNEAFTDAGLTRNAWQYLRLPDGKTAGEAYDAGLWS